MTAPRLCLAAIVGWAVGSACGIGNQLSWASINFTCEPAGPEQPPCPDGYNCCSDDAAYVGPFRLFSAEANERSYSGLCVNQYDIPEGSGLGKCPIPCNPRWPQDSIDEACGEVRVCCQTQELVEADCTFDEARGQWRPMDGRDAEAAFLAGVERWGDGTHQDPEFESCEAFAGSRDNPMFLECLRTLTVANQRGYCMTLRPGQPCPTEKDDYIDACGAMND